MQAGRYGGGCGSARPRESRKPESTAMGGVCHSERGVETPPPGVADIIDRDQQPG
jgi:hypothetical protein